MSEKNLEQNNVFERSRRPSKKTLFEGWQMDDNTIMIRPFNSSSPDEK